MRAGSHRRLARIALLAALAFALLAPLALSACGKRPENLEPLPPAREDEYPRQYPRE